MCVCILELVHIYAPAIQTILADNNNNMGHAGVGV